MLYWTNFADNLRWFRVVNCSKILLHSRIVVAALVQEITVFAIDGILLQWIDANLLRKIDSQDVEITVVEYFKSLLEALLPIS